MALRRIALPASGLYPIATFGLGIVAFAAAGSRSRQRFHRRLSGRGRARELRAAAPVGDQVVRRGAGLAGADRPVRPARPAGGPQRAGRRRWCLRSSSGWCCCWSRDRCRWSARWRVSACRGASNVPVMGGSARGGAHRAGDVPDRRGRARQPSAAEHRLHPGGGVHAGAGPQPAPDRPRAGPDSAGLAARDPGRIGAARRPGSRTADDDGAAVVATAQRHGRSNCGCPIRA